MGIMTRLEAGMRVACKEEETGGTAFADAPPEVGGKGEYMGPTDLFAASLGSCILVVMAMRARRLKLDLTGATAEVVKEMTQEPVYRVGRLAVTVRLPIHPDPDQCKQLEQVARHCPVHQSLHPDLEQVFHFEWGSK